MAMTSLALSMIQRLARALMTVRCSAITFFAAAMAVALAPPAEMLVLGFNLVVRLAAGMPYFAVGVSIL